MHIFPKLIFNKIKNMTLKWKIKLIILSLIIPIFLLMIISLSILVNTIKQDINTRFNLAEKSVKNALDLYKRQMIINAKMISANSIIQNKLNKITENNENQNLIIDKLLSLQKSAGVEFSWLYNKNGDIVAKGHKPTEKKIINDKNNSLFKNTISGDIVFTVDYINQDVLFFKYAVPIFAKKANSSDIIGTCVVASKISRHLSPAFAVSIQQISGVDILIIAENYLLSTSFGLSLGEAKKIPFKVSTTSRIINSKNYDIKLISTWNISHIKNFGILLAINNSKIKNALKNMIILVLIIFLIVISVSYIIARKVSQRIINSTHKILAGAEHITNKNFSYKVDIDGKDEFVILANSFNSMSNELSEYSEHLEELVENRTIELNKANKKLKNNNLQMRKDLEMAKFVQESIIPKTFPSNEHLDIEGIYLPMEDLGGDYYDVFQISETKTAFVIVDVSGHGASSALITTMAKTSFTNHSVQGFGIDEIVNAVNKDMYKVIGKIKDYLTAYYGILDLTTGEFEFINAGHSPALLYKSESNTIESLDAKGFFIGITNKLPFDKEKTVINENDRLFLFTDGIIESRNNDGDIYEVERLKDYILKYNFLSINELINGIIQDVEEFSEGEKIRDDRALLCIELKEKININNEEI